ncbi:MAG: hypothetical protein V8T31_02685 [Lachnospiraceae bacterium]
MLAANPEIKSVCSLQPVGRTLPNAIEDAIAYLYEDGIKYVEKTGTHNTDDVMLAAQSLIADPEWKRSLHRQTIQS